MNRRLSDFVPALILALVMLASSALSALAPRSVWTAAASVLLALGVSGIALYRRRRGVATQWAGVLIVLATLLVASAIIGADDPGQLADMVPLIGCCAAIPLILGDHRGCRLPWRRASTGA